MLSAAILLASFMVMPLLLQSYALDGATSGGGHMVASTRSAYIKGKGLIACAW
jgi:hypothetical protein